MCGVVAGECIRGRRKGLWDLAAPEKEGGWALPVAGVKGLSDQRAEHRGRDWGSVVALLVLLPPSGLRVSSFRWHVPPCRLYTPDAPDDLPPVAVVVLRGQQNHLDIHGHATLYLGSVLPR